MSDTGIVPDATGTDADNTVAAEKAPTNSNQSSDIRNIMVKDATDLQREAPEVYDAMMDSAARKIINDQKKHNARMKALRQEGQR